MKKSVLTFFLIIFTTNFLFSQLPNNIQEPHILPPTPDAAALGKYGNYPVGLNTGIPDIGIPIYTIKTKKLEVPISVSYHASGIKVNEFASWIGLGWSLNAGGVITRCAIGEPDDLSGLLDRYDVKNSSQLSSGNYWEYMRSVADNMYDTESDYYFYNFPGKAGKFVYPQNSSTPFLIPQTPISIIRKNNSYEIKDEFGITYKFNWLEDSRTIPNGPEDVSRTYTSSYYLTEIASADGMDHIYFTYESEGNYAENNMEFTQLIGKKCYEENPSLQTLNESSSMNISRTITPVRLKEIQFANGKVEFIKDTSRSDAPDTRLEEIKVYSKNSNGTFSLLKSFAFGEEYFQTSPGTNTEYYRLKLKDITEKDKNGEKIKKYSFDYNLSFQLPPRNSYAQDWWGYYNGEVGNSNLINHETDFLYEGIYFTFGGANREPDSVKMQAGILKKITFPTGGYTEFDYSPNYYSDLSQKKMAGGLRVKEIRDYESDGTLSLKKVYKYGTGETGTGTLLIPEEGIFNSRRELDSERWYPQGEFCNPLCWAKKMVITGRPSYELTTLNGSPVGYPEVTVYEVDSNDQVNGKQVVNFSVVTDDFQGVTKAYNNGRFQSNDSWKGGDELHRASFVSTTENKSEEVFNTYSLLTENNVIGTKIGWKVSLEGCPRYDSQIFSRLYYFDYNLHSGIKKLTENISRQYSSSGSTQYNESKSLYVYDSLGTKHQQLRSFSEITSRGDTIIKKFWYPADYTNDSLTVLLDSNIIAIPVKEETYRNNKQVEGKVTKYSDYGDPLRVYILETSLPRTIVNHDPEVIVPSGYAKRMDLAYGNYNNLESVQKSDDIKQTYIWGYRYTLPIAVVKNSERGAMSSDYSATNIVNTDLTLTGFEDIPLSESFEISASQNVSPTLNVSHLGSVQPPDTYLTIKLKDSNGNIIRSHGCTWGTNTIGSISLSPGIYQWYYYSDATLGGDFDGYDIYLETSYMAKRTGYKVFHTSFEDDGVPNSEAKTGKNVWTGVYALNLPGYNGNYKLTYWKKTGTGDWILNTQSITVSSGTVIPMDIGSAGSIIDELSLIPAAAGVEITTYTHEPLKGTSSVTDPNQNSSYYEYDDFGRLRFIRDNKKNILKSYSYHYKE